MVGSFRGACLIFVVCFSMAATGCIHPGRRSLEAPSGPSAGANSGGSNSDSGNSSKSDGSSDSGNSNTDSGGSDSDSGNSTLLSTVVGGIIALGVLITIGVLALADDAKAAQLDKAREYLKENRRTVQVALSRGAGPMIDDIAMTLELPEEHVQRLGVAIQDNRGALTPFLDDGEVTIEEAEGFCGALVAAIHTDPVLAPYLTTFGDKLASQIEAR